MKGRHHDRKIEHFKFLSAIVDHVRTTGHNINGTILPYGKTEYHCIVRELQPALNVNVSSEKLSLLILWKAFPLCHTLETVSI